MASHLRYYKYYVSIKDYDEDKIVFSEHFDDITDNEYFLVVDKQNLGEEIGASIIDKLNEDEIIEDDEFTDNFKDEMMTFVEEEFTNSIRDEICEYILDYLGNNL